VRRFVLFTVLTVGIASLASGCLWGQVRDADTGYVMPGVTVAWTDSEGHSASTTTNSVGIYLFDGAEGPVPAAGPVNFQLSAPDCLILTETRLVEYDDNPNASLDNPSSFWEVQEFALSCGVLELLPPPDIVLLKPTPTPENDGPGT
jgi:hypothetical protein